MASFGHKTINRYHTRRTLQRLSAQMQALGDPGQPSLAAPQGAAIVFTPSPQVDFKLTETFKDLDGDGAYKAAADVLDTTGSVVTTSQTGASSGTDTPDPPRQITVVDRGGRYSLSKVGDRGQAMERVISGVRTWDVASMREVRPQYLFQVTDDTGTTVAGTPLNVDLNNVIHDVGNIWELDESADDVEILATGPIRIDVTCTVEWASGSANDIQIHIEKDGSEIVGTKRITDVGVNGHGTVAISWVEDIVAQEKISVVLTRHTGTGNTTTVADAFTLILSAPWTDQITPLGWADDLGIVFDFNDATNPFRSDNVSLDPVSGSPTHSAGGPATDNFAEFESTTDSWLIYKNSSDNNFAIPIVIPSGFTMSAWVRLDDAGDYDIIWKTGKDAIVGVHEWRLEALSSAFKFTGQVFDSADAPITSATKTHSTGLSLATWYLVVCQVELFTATGTRMRVGVSLDGGAFEWSHAKDATAVAVGSTPALQDGGFLCMNKYFFARAGVDTGDVAYSVDMIRCWSRAISDTEVAYHYNSGAGKVWPFT